MTPGRHGLVDPPQWTDKQLERARLRAIELFRAERMREPLEAYLDEFEKARDAFDTLLETTVDLTEIHAQAKTVLCSKNLLEAVRYLAGPPISEDDLKVTAEVTSLVASKIGCDEEGTERVIDTVLLGLDRMRFPWMGADGNREPSEQERHAAVIASASLIATQRTKTIRQNAGKNAQEAAVMLALENSGFERVKARKIMNLSEAPKPGQFCSESKLGKRKADVVVGLWDNRTMPIECKVSNSALNSIKRLNNDAAAKAEAWRIDFGATQVVPTAMLSGVFDLHNLQDAQNRGLTLFWAHDLKAMVQWIETTRR